MNTTPIKEALQWRYAVNEFDTTKQVPQEELDYILESANFMPTAFGLQPFRFVVVEDKETKEKLVEHSYGQRHVADNSHLVVLAVRTDIDEAMIAEYTARIESTRGLPAGAVDGFKDSMVGSIGRMTHDEKLTWAQKQAYIALGGLMTASSQIGVDNHALEGFSADAYNEVLALKERNLHATVIVALGYRAESDETQHYKKVRVAMEDMVINL